MRSRSRRLETHSHACRALPPPPIGSSEAIRPVRLLSSLPPGPTHGPDVRREAATSRPFLSIPQGRHRSSLCLSVSLSFHPRCCCCCRWWWWWWVLTPPSPTRRALPLTASPFPKRSAGSLQTTPPPPLTQPSRARHRGGGPRSRGARARAQKPKLGAGRGDVWGDSGAEAASRLSEGEGEGGERCFAAAPRPALQAFFEFFKFKF